jgi:membrane-associated phospholipid phosphatase
MSIDSSIVRSLNSWGEHHRSLVKVCSNDVVYIVILLAALWFVIQVLKSHPIKADIKDFGVNLVTKGIVILAFPLGIAIVVSESISAIYVRQRPFVADSKVHLLVPHSADGGMPSHHIVFMAALVATIFYYDKRSATFFAILTLITGVARVVAGIHYPSDIIVGALIGVAIVYLYHRVLPVKALSLGRSRSRNGR